MAAVLVSAAIFVFSAAIFVISAVIFVIDSHNCERLDESHSALVKLVQEKELKDASLLIFANKQVRLFQWNNVDVRYLTVIIPLLYL